MDEKPVKYIIPTKLKTRLTFFGYYPEELLVIVSVFFIGFMQALYYSNKLMLIISAVLAVLLFRGPDGKTRNMATHLKLRYRMIFKPQIYTLRECSSRNENKRNH